MRRLVFDLVLLVTALWPVCAVHAEPPPIELKPPAHSTPPTPPPAPSKLGISTHMKFSVRPFSLKTSIDFSRSPDNNHQRYSSPDPIIPGYTPGGYSYNSPAPSSGYSSPGYSYIPPVKSGGYSYIPPTKSGGYSYIPPVSSDYSYNEIPKYRPPSHSYYTSSSYQPYQVSYETGNKGQSAYTPSYKYDPWKPVYSPPMGANYRDKSDLVKHIFLHSGKRKSDFHYKLVLVNKYNPEERHEIHLPPILPELDEPAPWHTSNKGWTEYGPSRDRHLSHFSGHNISPYRASREDLLQREYSAVRNSYAELNPKYRSQF